MTQSQAGVTGLLLGYHKDGIFISEATITFKFRGLPFHATMTCSCVARCTLLRTWKCHKTVL